MARIDNRANDQIRDIKITRNYTRYAEGSVLIEMGETKVSLTLNDAAVVVNGERKEIDVPAQAIDGRTLVPVRAVSESYNCTVTWDQDTQTVIINN